MSLVQAIDSSASVTIVGSAELLQAFTGNLPTVRFETPLEIVRGLRAGTAPKRLVSFPELLGGEGPSSVPVDVDGQSCRFSTINARLVYAGYSAFCLRVRRWPLAPRLVDMTGLLRVKESEAEMILEINKILGVGLVSTQRDHLYPSIVKRKTAAGLAMGAADHARDMIGTIRLICAACESPTLPQQLIKGLSDISRLELQDEPETKKA